MKILIIEDEPFAAKSLMVEVRKIEPDSIIEGPIPTVKQARNFLLSSPLPDLILCDIQLSDGIAFDIFKADIPPVPVIFTTAFNEFSLRAFKLNSIDYLLKPIDGNELAESFRKFKRIHSKYGNAEFMQQFHDFFGQFPHVQPYKERLAVHEGKSVVFIKTADVLYFSKTGEVICVTVIGGNEYVTDYRSLDEASELLNPQHFIRANRQFLVNMLRLLRFQTDLHGRILLYFEIEQQPEIAVSKDKAAEFKKHLR